MNNKKHRLGDKVAHISFRATDDFRQNLQTKAKQNKMSLSEFLRMSIEKGLK